MSQCAQYDVYVCPCAGAVDAQAQGRVGGADQGAGVRVRVRPALPQRRAARARAAGAPPRAAAGALQRGRGSVSYILLT